jgi:hypothetical protein
MQRADDSKTHVFGCFQGCSAGSTWLVHVVPAVFVFIDKDVYKKLVVIVNGFLSVDKKRFVYNVNGLRIFQYAGKVLYRCCTDVGQKTGKPAKRRFCTSDPVDMQAFFHSRAGFQPD